MKKTLVELAQMVGGELKGDPTHFIQGAAGLAEATPSDVSFLGNPKYAPGLKTTKAGAVFLRRSDDKDPDGGPKNKIFVEAPQWAFAQVLRVLEGETLRRPQGIDSQAKVHDQAILGRDVCIGPFCVVEAGARIGDRTVLLAQCYVGANAVLGQDCLLYPQAVVRENCELGDRVIVHSSTVIGSDGYGFFTDKGGLHHKIPQIGRVVVEEDVEIGSNVSVDRATTGATRIGAGTKIDNLVQIAHNVQIGKNCLIVAQVGISGSTVIGNRVVLAGQAGIVGHLTIGDGAVITAQTGVMNDVGPGEVLFGYPARPHREAMKLQALLSRLPEMYAALKNWKKSNGGA